MANDVQYLLDRTEIKDVLYRYARGIDRRDFALVADCYTADALFKTPVNEHRGRGAIVESARRVEVSPLALPEVRGQEPPYRSPGVWMRISDAGR